MLERRKQARMEAAYEVFVTEGGKTFVSKSRDISPRGIGILVPEPIRNDSPVDLTVVPTDGMINVSVKGATRYCVPKSRPENGRNFIVGIEFSRESGRDLPFFEKVGEVKSFRVSHSVPIDASPDECYRLISDFPRYPEWAKVLDSIKVIDRHQDGRARRVEFNVNTYFRKIQTILDYSYDDKNHGISWVSAGGDFVKVTGRYFFSPLSEGRCSSTYQLNIDINFFIPDRITNYFSGIVMRKTMKDFRKFVEKELKK